MPVTGDEMIQAILTPFQQEMVNDGITRSALSKQLKSELKATKTIVMAIDGHFKSLKEVLEALRGGELSEKEKRQLKKITGGVKFLGVTKKKTLIAVDVPAHDIRQKARISGNALWGDEPTKKVELSGTIDLKDAHAKLASKLLPEFTATGTPATPVATDRRGGNGASV